MIDIFFLPANILPTILFLVIVLYWIVVLVGVVDFDAIEIDFDVEMDADIEVDAEVDSSNIFGFNRVLEFFNLGKVPFMIWLTFVSIPWWFGTIIVNNMLGVHNFFIGLLISIPILIVSLFIAKFLTMPFVKVFASLEKGEKHQELLGVIGNVRLEASPEKIGQAEFKVGDSFLLLQIRTKEKEVRRGDTVMIVSDKNKDEYYLVEKQITI